MKRLRSLWFWTALLLIPYFVVAGQPTGVDYNVDLAPGIQVIPVPGGANLLNGTFKLYHDLAPSDVLTKHDFVVKIDGTQVSATIVQPPKPKASADVVFCMDISGSMGTEIDAARNHTQGFVDRLMQQNYDVQLGLITFGQRTAPYMRQRNNGQFYTSPQDFVAEMGTLVANGAIEEWFDCLVKASQYPFRAGAERIAILITDENGNASNYDLNTALPIIKSNALMVYGISYDRLGNVVKAVSTTNGQLYYIKDPFDSILNKLANSIFNTYTIALATNVGPGQHFLHVTPSSNNPGGEDKEPFKIGANPEISLSQTTQDLIANGIAPGTGSISVEANITDLDGSIKTANIIWQDAANNGSDSMNGAGSTYSYTYNGTLADQQCFAFAIQAIDDEGRSVTAPANQANTPDGKWRICVSDSAPVFIGNITPDTYDYQQPVTISADIDDQPNGPAALAVTLRFRETGTAAWMDTPMSQNSGTTFTATVPDAFADFNGLEVEVVAQDISNNVTTKSHTLTVNAVPVTVAGVTRYTDTLDTGPFSVQATVAGLDSTQSGQVELNYTVNGGAGGTVPMTVVAANSNLYAADIPVMQAGDKVCYLVKASNPTTNAQSAENCFDVLQPATPLSIAPASAVLVLGDAPVELTATGGYGGYEWSALKGTLSATSGDKSSYTPVLAGSDKVSVKDSKGFTETIVINVLPALATDPVVEGKRFLPNSTVLLTATGAEPPYQWQVEGAASTTAGNDNETAEIALGADTATIKVTLTDNKGRATTATFTNNGQMQIEPAGPEIVVIPDSETPFNVTGGDGNYIWTVQGGDVDDPNAASVIYKAPTLPGVYHVTVSDGSGTSATVRVKSGQPLRVTPTCARLQQGETVDFQIASGTPPYQWEATFGALSAASGDIVTYTPESALGLYEIKVYDSAGTVANLCVEVMGGLLVTPENATLKVGETVSLSASGGNGNYLWHVDAGNLSSTTSASVDYTAPGQTGTYTVEVTDTAGNPAATATITVVLEGDAGLTLNPSNAVVQVNGTAKFKAVNGIAPYTWSVDMGTVAPTQGSNTTYTAPAQKGMATVTVTDAAGNQKTATVQIIGENDIALTASSTSVQINSTLSLSATGGTGVYEWSASVGAISPGSDNTAVYTAPSQPNTDVTVTVTDSAGQTAVVAIKVVPVGSPLTANPAKATVYINGSRGFNAVGGQPPYTWTAEKGTLSSNKGSRVNYTAPGNAGRDTITLTDATGVTTTVTVTVEDIALSVTPSVTAVETGASRSFSARGGDGNYKWTAEKGSLSAATGETVTYTAPDITGKDTVILTDSAGHEIKAKVTVLLPLDDMAITPVNVELLPNASQQFKVNGALGTLNWAASGGTILPEGFYTAPASSGTYEVIATDSRTGRNVTATVKVAPKLTLTPMEASVTTEGGTSFTVSGGEPPYTWTVLGEGFLDSTSGETVRFSAAQSAGIVRLVVSDNKGISQKAKIEIHSGMLITPGEAHLPPGQEQVFTVSGGDGDITWTATQGNIDSTGRYTTPDMLGTYTITANDGTGKKAYATVTVANIPVATPSTIWLERSGSKVINVVGGVPPYQWQASTGRITPPDVRKYDGSVVVFHAPDISGEVLISVTDNLGNVSQVTAYIDFPLMATREEIFLEPGQAARITAVGGIPPFNWKTVRGETLEAKTEEEGTNVYQAPNVMGEDTITIIDRKGDEVTVAIHATRPLAVTPYVRYMERGKTKSFDVVSGVAPYTARVVDGDGDIEPLRSEDGHFRFTAGKTADQDVVLEFSDSTGQTTQVHAYVERTFRVSPKTLFVDKGKTAKFKATGGTGDFVVIADQGFAEVDPTTGTGEVETPNRFGNYKLTFTDSADQEVTVDVIVDITTPVISPSKIVLAPGDKQNFMVDMGSAPYEWSFEGNLWDAKNTERTLVEITAPKTAGEYKLSLLDNAGNTTSATVKVVQPLVLSPVSHKVYPGKSKVIRFERLGGAAGPCDWILSNDAKAVKKDDNHILVKLEPVLRVGDEVTVHCRDLNGDIAKAKLIVTHYPGDLNQNGTVDPEEAEAVLDAFFRGGVLNGVQMSRQEVYEHIEAIK